MRKTTLAASALVAAFALGACGGGDGSIGGDFGASDRSTDRGEFGDFEGFDGSAGSSAADDEFQANFEANLDQFIANGLGLDEPLSEGGVATDSATPVLDGGLLAPDALADALAAIEAEHGTALAPLLVRITATQVIVAVDEDGRAYAYEDGRVTAIDAVDLGTFGPAPLTGIDLDVDLESLVLYASDVTDFDPELAVEVTIGRSRLKQELAFARIVVWTQIEGYVDISLVGDVLVDSVA